MSGLGPSSVKLPMVETALSPYVRELIVVQTGNHQRDPGVLDGQGLIDFQYICSKLPEPEDNQSYFRDSVRLMAPMFEHASDALQCIDVQQFQHRYHDYLQWTGKAKFFMDTFELLMRKSDTEDIFAMLVITAALERALGDLYLLTGPQPCPSMLKDLLLTQELRDQLGPHVIQVLRVLIGPPISLNLRNVIWHGFPHPGELPRRCVWFLLILVPSIGKVLTERCVDQSKIPHREPVIFPRFPPLVASLHLESEIDKTPQPIPTFPHGSSFVAWETKQFWSTVQDQYTCNRFGHCAALLLYVIEQGLRRVFTTVNNCPARLLTAESTTLYTTFDEILDRYLPDGSENQLIHVLGEPVMDLLFDQLVHQDGPRVRDRLSHGEADWDTFPWQLAHSLSVTCVVLATKFVTADAIAVLQSPDILEIQTLIENYESRFHRISLIKSQVRQLFTKTALIDGVILYTPDLALRTGSGTRHSNTRTVAKQQTDVRSLAMEVASLVLAGWRRNADTWLEKLFLAPFDAQSIFNDILDEKIRTVYRGLPKPHQASGEAAVAGGERESEVVGLIYRVIAECNTVVTQLHDTVTERQGLLQSKQLRSRQRENLKKLYSSCPTILTCVHLIGLLVAWQLYHLDTTHTQSDTSLKHRTKLWKLVLQFSENLRTYTSAEKNKWTECLDLSLTLCQKLVTVVPPHLLGTR